MTASSTPPPLQAPIDWLFVDIGGVLLDNRPLFDALYRYVADWLNGHGTPVTLEQVHATRDRFARQGVDGVYKRVMWDLAPDDDAASSLLSDFRDWLEPRQFELNPLFDGVPETLATLAERYQLALAANQGAYIHDLLREHGIHRYFSASAIAGEIGVAKPEEGFFRHLLDVTGVPPERAVMVGDSVANDLNPAHLLGLRTVLVAEEDSMASGEDAERDKVTGRITAFRELPALLARWASLSPGDHPENR